MPDVCGGPLIKPEARTDMNGGTHQHDQAYYENVRSYFRHHTQDFWRSEHALDCRCRSAFRLVADFRFLNIGIVTLAAGLGTLRRVDSNNVVQHPEHKRADRRLGKVEH